MTGRPGATTSGSTGAFSMIWFGRSGRWARGRGRVKRLLLCLQERSRMRASLMTSLVAVLIGGSALAALAPAHAGPVVGAGTCGQFVGVPPSTFMPFITAMRNGTPTGEVLFASHLAMYDIQILCLINAERASNELPALIT